MQVNNSNKKIAKEVILHCKDYIQPFELVLANAEVNGLLNKPTYKSFDEVSTPTRTLHNIDPSSLINRLAYWDIIRIDGKDCPTKQVQLEMSDEITSQSVLDGVGIPKLPNRRKLRYGAHDIHE